MPGFQSGIFSYAGFRTVTKYVLLTNSKIYIYKVNNYFIVRNCQADSDYNEKKYKICLCTKNPRKIISLFFNNVFDCLCLVYLLCQKGKFRL